MPRNFREEDEDDVFEHPREHYSAQPAYHDAPDPEEISYTKRMFAIRDEEAYAPKQEPIRLPAPPVKPSEQPHVIFAPPPRTTERTLPRQTEPTIEHKPEPAAHTQPEMYQTRPVQNETTHADQLAQHLVNTARTRYSEAQSSAAYRPVSADVKPYEPQQKSAQAQASTPRVFDYKQQAKTQPAQKQTVTHIRKDSFYNGDDEE